MTRPEPSPRLVVMGCSAGGLAALRVVLGALPATFSLPVLIVQHRAPDSGAALVAALARAALLPVSDALDKQPIEGAHVVLAPADYHLLVEGAHLALSVEPPVRHARPAIDPLFESAAECFGAGLVAVVLTGASDDGARGAVAVRARGGRVVVQDPSEAYAAIMPAATLQRAGADLVLPLDKIGPWLAALCPHSQRTRDV